MNAFRKKHLGVCLSLFYLAGCSEFVDPNDGQCLGDVCETLGDAGDTGSGGASVSELAKTICERGAECDADWRLEFGECVLSVSVFFEQVQSLVSAGAEQCIADLLCKEVPVAGKMDECIGFDSQGGDCVGPLTLEFCNSAGECADVDCKKLCAAVWDDAVAECQSSESSEIDTCSCSLSLSGGESGGGGSSGIPEPVPGG
jgi:hypothetical protein